MTVDKRRTGRRPGRPDTRQAILVAARQLFAQRGYERTTIRAVAEAASVDPALVHHYFGSKSQLFAAVGQPPFDPTKLVADLDIADEQAGYQLARRVLAMQDQNAQARTTLAGLLRAAATQEEAADAVRELFTATVHAELRRVFRDDTAELRASLIASQFVGLLVARHIIGFPGLADAAPEELAIALAPVVQHYLSGDITRL